MDLETERLGKMADDLLLYFNEKNPNPVQQVQQKK